MIIPSIDIRPRYRFNIMIIKKLNKCSAFIAGDKTIIRELMHPSNDEVIGYSLAHAEVKKGQSSVAHRLKVVNCIIFLREMGRCM